ncbi:MULTISPECIES: NAD(P)-dependent alcohol dehydrogenase [unclassified Nonomuraea]|uniref:NAD(P)-dependent alcohol dehydrogenase n=1 Tax=unclassified Nonomuraea TaxID=2593643 RepID=UPI0035C0BCA7
MTTTRKTAVTPTYARPPTGETTTMKAIVQDTYGPADRVLRLADVDRPTIGDDEVLVRVQAAGVDPGTWHLVTGLPYVIRLAGFGVRAPKTRVRGLDLAGRVVAVGKDVTGLRPGDEVFGIGEGAFAEYARAPQDKLALRPKNLTAEQAAAIPVSALSALQAVRDSADVRPGHNVLIIGASGGVGTFAVQIAKAFGADVTGVCSTAKAGLVRSLGADHVIDYTLNGISDAGRRYDVILDMGGNRSLTHLRRALTPRGTLVIVGAEADGRWIGGAARMLRAPLLSRLVRQKLVTLVSSENARDLLALTELIESGTVTPVLDRTFPLHETPAAIGYVRQGHARGKVVVTV